MHFNRTGIGLVLLLSFFTGCEKKNWDINNLNNGKIEIIGHKGSGTSSASNPVPDNSMQSFRNALELYGADGIEMDVQMSKDGVPFLYHDEVLDTKTNMQGCISSYTAVELKECRYNNSNEQLASLEECLVYCYSLKQMPKIFIDTKPEFICNSEGYSAQQVLDWYGAHLFEVFDAYNLYNHAYVESGTAVLIDYLKRRDNRIRFMLNGVIPDHLPLVDSMQIYGMMLGNGDIDAARVNLAHSHNLRISLFAVNNKNDAKEAIAKSPDFILTDDILLLKQLLDQ